MTHRSPKYGRNCKPNPKFFPDTSQWFLSFLLVAFHISFFLWILIFQTSSSLSDSELRLDLH